MQEERLLERLRTMAQDPTRRGSQDTERLVRSILNHVQKVLNTRQGSVPLSEDFGMPDITYLTSQLGSEAPREIGQTIKQAIQKYEPRLMGVKVNFTTEDKGILTMRFQVTARLAANADVPVSFATIISGDGQISVSI